MKKGVYLSEDGKHLAVLEKVDYSFSTDLRGYKYKMFCRGIYSCECWILLTPKQAKGTLKNCEYLGKL